MTVGLGVAEALGNAVSVDEGVDLLAQLVQAAGREQAAGLGALEVGVLQIDLGYPLERRKKALSAPDQVIAPVCVHQFYGMGHKREIRQGTRPFQGHAGGTTRNAKYYAVSDQNGAEGDCEGALVSGTPSNWTCSSQICPS